MRIIIVVFFILTLLPKNASGQLAEVEGFVAEASINGVILSWTIVAGNTCNGIRIFRSLDSIQYNQIGIIDGICGNPTESIDYTFVDQNPVANQVNYYKLDLGGLGFSHVVQEIYFDIAPDGYLLYPNPSLDYSRVLFQNPANRLTKIQVFDILGDLVYVAETNQSEFKLPTTDFTVGMYYFKLIDEDESKVINGKFEVGK